MTTLALYSYKGGVGKTTAAVNLAYLAAKSGRRTLLCDLDAQSAATYYLKVDTDRRLSAQNLAKGGQALENSLISTPYTNLDLLPGDLSHRQMDLVLDGLKHSRSRLRRAFEPLQAQYDLILIDAPPALNLLAENIFKASDALLSPLIPSTLSVRAHQQLLAFLGEAGYESKRVFAYLSMVDRRKKMHREAGLWIYQNFRGVLQTPIPYLSQVERMGLERRPVMEYAGASPAAQAYRDLWREVDEKILRIAR